MDESKTLKRDMIGAPSSSQPADVDGNGDDLNITAVLIKQEPLALDSIKQEHKYQSVKVECFDSVNEELFANPNSTTLNRDMIGAPSLNIIAVLIKQEPLALDYIKQEHKYQPIKVECSDSVKDELYADTNSETNHDSEDARMVCEVSEKDEIGVMKSKIKIFDNYLENSNTVSGSKSTMTDRSFRQPHKCTICEKTFTNSSNLKPHLLTHSGKKPHKCAICEKTYTASSSLKQHLFTHSDIKPHKCKVCEKTFTKGCDLKNHLHIHSDIKPHKCTICEKTFTQRSQLKLHVLTHSGIKPHKCAICEKTYFARSSMKQHLFTHSGIKPHKCAICEKSFTLSSSLKQHLYTHSGIKLYTCAICQKQYSSTRNLKNHLIKHTDKK